MSETDPQRARRILDRARQTVSIEARALADLEAALGEAFVEAVQRLLAVKGKVIVTGMGKSGHVANKIAATLASTGTPSFFLHPAESVHGDLGMVGREDGVIAISYSGETGELNAILPWIKRQGLPIVAITGRKDSTLARLSDITLHVPIQQEACPHNLAPTASTTATLALGDALAMALLDQRGFREEDFRNLHPGGSLGRRLTRVRDLMAAGPLPSVSAGTPLALAVPVMSEKREGHGRGIVAVMDKSGRMLGAVTDGDLRRRILAGAAFDAPVDEVMTKNPKTIAADAVAESALELMERHSVSALFVHEGDPARPVGVLYLHALLKAQVI